MPAVAVAAAAAAATNSFWFTGLWIPGGRLWKYSSCYYSVVNLKVNKQTYYNSDIYIDKTTRYESPSTPIAFSIFDIKLSGTGRYWNYLVY